MRVSQTFASQQTGRSVEERLQRRFDLLFAQTTEPMLITDGLGTILDANQPLLDLLRMTKADFLATEFASYLGGGESEQLRVRAERMAQGSLTGETMVHVPGRPPRKFRFWTIEVETADGGLRAYIGVTPVGAGPSAQQMSAILHANFDDSPDGKLVSDAAGRTLYANRRHMELWDLTEEDLVLPFAERWAITRTRLKNPRAFKNMLEAVEQDPAVPHAATLELVNGRILEVRTAAIPFEGDVPGLAFTARDITEQANAQKRLRAAATLLESVSTNSPEGIIVVDLQGEVLHHNQRFLDTWDVDESYLRLPIQERWKLLLPHAVDPVAFAEASRRLSEDMPMEFETEFSMTNGKTIHLVTKELRDAGGELLGRACFYRDVTAERQAEAVLRESEERYRTLIATLPVGVVMQHLDGTIATANPAAEQILGLTRDQMLGLTSFDPRWRCVREDGTHCPGEEHPASVTLRTGQPVSNRVMGIHHANGALRWLFVNSHPLHGEDGALHGAVITFQDVTEQRNAERTLTKARTAEAFQSLASGVAHKINNSLASIVGNAYLAGLSEGLPSATTESLTEIVNAASDSTALVRDLIALSGGGRHILREADLSAEAARVLADLAPDERGRVAESLAAGLPAVLIDSNALGQAIGNVLRNAFEAGDSVQLRTRLEEDYVPAASATYAPARPTAGRYLVIEVADDGPGIAPEVAGRLFEPFVSTKFAGRGLGLAATAGIMGSQHGFVEVSSTTEGCRVLLLLPAP